ncbi:hypothetical protein [Alloactinosynnema sp. L-07]|uniref:DUF1579 family protein n=1 Tax=Alloactinosynnema sp. L-07 TaxID=1653480 RepID=UPI00065EFB64|nr:DUF1579 family protein [Alloactinosynnema sp. L-07]CRK56576.1 hypothetical protein [Alloactinosynnema sp. L-07]
MSENTQIQPLTPDPALKALDKFIGSWEMRGGLVGAEEQNIHGKVEFRWMPGGFFLEQHISLDFAGMVQIDSTEIIGYDPETGTYPSTVYSNMSPQPLPYLWRVDGDEVTITVNYGPLDATFTGRFTDGGNSFGGSWRPNPGADETVNVAYDVAGGRVS